MCDCCRGVDTATLNNCHCKMTHRDSVVAKRFSTTGLYEVLLNLLGGIKPARPSHHCRLAAHLTACLGLWEKSLVTNIM